MIDRGDGDFYALWGEYENFRSVASTPYLQDHVDGTGNYGFNPAKLVFGGRAKDDGSDLSSFNDGFAVLVR